MTATMLPAEWLRDCPDCGRPVYLPADRHPSCQEARHLNRTAWPFCDRCGGLRDHHAETCITKGTHR